MFNSGALSRRGAKTGLAKALVVLAFLNLNGFMYMLVGVTQVFSLLILICSITLVALQGRFILRMELALFLLLIFGYAFFGSVFIILLGDPGANAGELITITGTFLLVFSIFLYLDGAETIGEFDSLFRFARNVAIIAAVANLLSPFLYSIYSNPPPSASYRSAGLFANPNDAGLIGIIALALTLQYPFRWRIAQILLLAAIAAATFITFSRGAIVLAFFLLLLSAVGARRSLQLIVVPVLVIVLAILFLNIEGLLHWLNIQTLFELEPQQLNRIQATLYILDGQFDGETTGVRNELAGAAISKALSVFPLGTGLHSFQSIVGGIRGGSGEWLGAHNSFLMLWGEAGFHMLLLLIAFCIVLPLKLVRGTLGLRGLCLPVVFVGCAMFGHELFSLRFMNVTTALMMAQSSAAFYRTPTGKPRNASYRKLDFA